MTNPGSWVTPEIKEIDRKKKREYVKHRKSEKWRRLNEAFQTKCNQAKSCYYTKIVGVPANGTPSLKEIPQMNK